MLIKKYTFIILALIFAISLVGCKAKEVAQEELANPDLMQQEAQLSIPAPQPTSAQLETAQAVSTESEKAVSEAAAPVESSKPTAKEIQTALKNAGYYTGKIDGDIGPLSKKAIEEFQGANNLTVDAKVGPQTWALLSQYLEAAVPTTTDD